MRRHLLGVFQGFFCTILLSSEALPAVTMVFDDFPATPFGCEFEAKELGERLKALGVRVNSTQCYRDNLTSKTYELRVLYTASSPLVEESTYKAGANFYSKGWYKTQADCEADLDEHLAGMRAGKLHRFDDERGFGLMGNGGTDVQGRSFWVVAPQRQGAAVIFECAATRS